jgi:hypothetical protein
MVEEFCDCAFSQRIITRSVRLSLMQSHSKTSHDFDCVYLGHYFEEEVVAKFDAFGVLGVLVPCPSFIVKYVPPAAV